MSIEAMKLALDALEDSQLSKTNAAIKALEEALKQEQDEPVAMRYDFDGYGYKYIDIGSGSDWQTRIKDAEPVYSKPQPKQEQGEPYTIHTLHCVCGKTWQMDVCPTKIKE